MQSSTSDRAGFERELAATDRPLRDLALWLGILGPPALWLAQFQMLYALVLPVCVNRDAVVLTMISMMFGVAIIICGLVGWNGRKPAADFPARIKPARHFMATLALMSMSLFVVVLIAQTIATAMQSPCPI